MFDNDNNTQAAPENDVIVNQVETDHNSADDQNVLEERNQQSDQKADGDDAQTDNDQSSKKNGVQKRIDKLVKKLSEARLDAETSKQELFQMRQQIDQLSLKVNGDGRPNPDNFEKYSDYLEALTEWKIDQKSPKQQNQAVKPVVTEAYVASVAKAKEMFPDFEVVMQAADIPASPEVMQAIANSEFGAEVAYLVASDEDLQDEFVKIKDMKQFYRMLGRLEAQADLKRKQFKPKSITNAPPPIKPAGSSRVVSKDYSKMSFDEFYKARNAEVSSKRGS